MYRKRYKRAFFINFHAAQLQNYSYKCKKESSASKNCLAFLKYFFLLKDRKIYNQNKV